MAAAQAADTASSVQETKPRSVHSGLGRDFLAEKLAALFQVLERQVNPGQLAAVQAHVKKASASHATLRGRPHARARRPPVHCAAEADVL